MKRLFLLIVFVVTTLFVNAQTIDFGGKLGVEYSKKLGKSWHLNLTEEVKFHHNFTKYDNFKSGIGFDYSFLRKKMKTGVEYLYINKYTETRIYENRHRVNVNISYSERIRQFKLTYRARFQTTFRDESRNDYKFNPKIYMRNKFQVSYTLRNQPMKFLFSEEFFWRLDRPDRRVIDRLQTTIGYQYRFDRRNSMLIYIRATNEIQVKAPEHLFSLGVVYKYKH